MGFMDSYKRLEKLCRDIFQSDKPVKAYIEEMKSLPRGSYWVDGWDEDLNKLKHYLWVRNQISHDPDCSEENMCNIQDVYWIDNFYNRIMKQTDPLALYREATKPQYKPTPKPVGEHRRYVAPPNESYNNSNSSNKLPDGCTVALVFCAVIVVVVIIFAMSL